MIQLSYSFSAEWDTSVKMVVIQYTLKVNSRGVHSVQRMSYIYVHCKRVASYEHNHEQNFTR